MKQFTIVTGMSGSGKTRVIRFLEDMGFFCVDNMPPMLIPTFGELLLSSGKFENVAIVVDIRVGEMISELVERVNTLRCEDFDVKLLFLNAPHRKQRRFAGVNKRGAGFTVFFA